MDEERMLSGVSVIQLWLSEGRTGLDPRVEKGANLFGLPPSRHGNHSLSRVEVFREQLGHSPWGIPFNLHPSPQQQ